MHDPPTFYRCRNGDDCEDGPDWTADAFTHDAGRPMGDRLCNACIIERYGRRKRRRCVACGSRFRTRIGEDACPDCRHRQAA